MGANHTREVSGEASLTVHQCGGSANSEALVWAEAWAKRLHEEAPPESVGFAHCTHETGRIWGTELVDAFPAHLRGPGLSPRLLVRRALIEQHLSRDGARADCSAAHVGETNDAYAKLLAISALHDDGGPGPVRCTHGEDDDAFHDDVTAWAWQWVERLLSEGNPLTVASVVPELGRLYADALPRFAGCAAICQQSLLMRLTVSPFVTYRRSGC